MRAITAQLMGNVLLDEHVQVAFSHIGEVSPEPTSLRAASLRRIVFSKFNKDLVSKTFAPRLYHQIAIGEGQSIHRAISNANATPQRTANFLAPIVKNLPSVAICLFVDFVSHHTLRKSGLSSGAAPFRAERCESSSTISRRNGPSDRPALKISLPSTNEGIGRLFCGDTH
jgi:hypothetical protein